MKGTVGYCINGRQVNMMKRVGGRNERSSLCRIKENPVSIDSWVSRRSSLERFMVMQTVTVEKDKGLTLD